MMILMLSALWFNMCSKAEVTVGFFTLIKFYQNQSELLQLQKDEVPVNTYVAAIVEKLLL